VKKVLILGGHYDDSVIAVGGVIRKLANQGCRVSVACFGNGDEAFAALEQRDTCVEAFKAEAVKAHQVLGVEDLQCFDLPDFAVQENRETYRQCIGAIRRTQPDIILGHYWLEYFQHRAMARLACDSWWQAGWNCSADLGAPWTAPAMYHFEVLHTMPEPTHIVDISDTFEAKLAAWRQFLTAQDHLDEMAQQLEARARFHGSKIGVRYAEALTRSYFIPAKVTNPLEELLA
jgi:LmbE family N-acetylglucosaminyl deacetylase